MNTTKLIYNPSTDTTRTVSVGDIIACANERDMIDMSVALAKCGVYTEFNYNKDTKQYWLTVESLIAGADEVETLQREWDPDGSIAGVSIGIGILVVLSALLYFVLTMPAII